ncbi:MAG: PilN domain-containing protein [Gammaproteobacteria bacterium]|nr:PilN domain-containing protein [Gammaproteobacteria bacterium]
MTRINLFPWREQVEEQKRRQFILLFGLTNIAVIIIMIIMSWSYSHDIKIQTQNNEYLNDELVKVNKSLRQIDELKAQKNALISRLSVIQRIERDRYYTLDLFNEVVNLINPMIVLIKMTRKDNMVKISGAAESNGEVAKFLRALEISPYFKDADLDQIKINQPEEANPGQASVPNTVLNTAQIGGVHNVDLPQKNKNELTHFFDLQFYQIHFNGNGEEIIDNTNTKPNTENTENIEKTKVEQNV